MKLSLANLAPLKEIDVNDPALMRSRAAKDQMGKSKSNPRIGFDQALDLRGEKQDLEREISNVYKDMNHEAGQMGQDEFEKEGRHDYYGDQLNRLEARLYKIDKQIDSYDMSEGQKIGKTSYKTRTAVVTAPGKTEDKEIFIDNTDDLNNVTIRWRGANHHGNKTLTNLKFTKESEFDEDLMAFSNDSKWLFIVDLDEETGEPDWDTLMVDNRELENVADDGTSTYSVPPEDMINEGKELDSYQKSIAAKWDKESTKLGGGLFDTSRELEKTDTKQFNINVNNKKEYLTDLNNAGKLKKTYSDDQIENWTINPSITGSTIASKVKPKTKLKEAYSSMYGTMKEEDGMHKMPDGTMMKDSEMEEGSCGYSQDAPGGEELDTPGGIQGMDADTRTRGMIQMFIQKEIKKLHETDYADRLANSGTDSDGRNTWGDKTGYSDEEMAQGKGKLKRYPDKDGRNVWGDKTDYSDKEKAKLKKGPYSPGGQNAQQENLEDKLKGAFSPEEMDKINSKQVPSFADMKPKEKKSKFKKAGEKSGFDMRGLK